MAVVCVAFIDHQQWRWPQSPAGMVILGLLSFQSSSVAPCAVLNLVDMVTWRGARSVRPSEVIRAILWRGSLCLVRNHWGCIISSVTGESVTSMKFDE